MIVALSQRQQHNQYSLPIDVLEHRYVEYCKESGVVVLPLPNIAARVQEYFDVFPIEGIILTGGEDIDPKFYGENIEWPNTTPLRDEAERMMLEIAVRRKLPVLGICRGMQFINVFFGGKMAKNIKEEITADHPPRKEHLIILTDDRSITLAGKKEITVNSYHNQAVTPKVLAPELKSFAIAEHEIIEGLYHHSLPIAGVQWHLERKMADEGFSRTMMEAFVERKLFWKK